MNTKQGGCIRICSGIYVIQITDNKWNDDGDVFCGEIKIDVMFVGCMNLDVETR